MQKKQKMNHKKGWLIGILLRYLIGSMVLVLLYVGLHRGFSIWNSVVLIQIWGDAFVITSVVVLEVVGISWLNRHGYIDWVGYSLELSRFLLRQNKSDKSFVNYYDYKMLRERNAAPLWPGVLSAFVLLMIGIVLSIVYVSLSR